MTGETATPLMIRISRALEIGDAFSHHDARGFLPGNAEDMRPDKNYIYIRIAPMRVDHVQLDMVMDCLHRLAKAKITSHIYFSGSYEDADAKGWFEPDKAWRKHQP